MSKAKTRILDVAEDLFMDRGYEVVKLKDIANTLEIKQPSLYYHFPNGKEQIYFEVVSRALQKVNKGLLETIAKFPDDIHRTLIAVGSWAKEDMGMSPIVMNKIDMPLLSEDHQKSLRYLLFTQVFKPIKEIFEQAKSRGEIRDVDTSVLAGMVLSLLEIMDGKIPISESKMESWKSSVDILLRGIMNTD